MIARQQFCTFRVDGGVFGVEVERVQEVLRGQETTRVPLAPSAVAGLCNLRGEIVPAIDLRVCMGVGEEGAGGEGGNVVLLTPEGPVSLVVDEIGDVVEVSSDAFEPPPDNLRGAPRGLIRGVYKLPRGLLLVLAPDAVIATATAPLADKQIRSTSLT